MKSAELWQLSAGDLGRMMRAGEVSPVEVLESVLARIDRLNPTLRAFLTVTDVDAVREAKAAERRLLRGEALGPLDGIPYSIKDQEPTAGVTTTYGSKFFEHHVPTSDGVVSSRLRGSGGVLLGKTNTPYFGHKDTTDNLLGPPCANPWDPTKTTGGSSGGAAAAVAVGLGPLAHGSDGAGSVRMPSALCGVVGFKPSFGRIPFAPYSDYWAATAHNGPITRTVEDAALMLQVLSGGTERDPLSIDHDPIREAVRERAGERARSKVRLAWTPDFGYGTVDPEVAEIAESAAVRMEKLGWQIERRDPGWDDPEDLQHTLYSVAFATRLEEAMATRPEWVDDTLKALVQSAEGVSGIRHKRAEVARGRLYEQSLSLFGECDILMSPTMPRPAWSADDPWGPRAAGVDWLSGFLRRAFFCYPFNLTGQPAISVPCGWTSTGLPVGLQLVGRWHADEQVLALAAEYERAHGWSHRWPPLAEAP